MMIQTRGSDAELSPERPARAGSFFACTPRSAALAMPIQSLRRGEAPIAPLAAPNPRRNRLLAGAVGLSAVATSVMGVLLSPGGFGVLDGAVLVLFAILFAWTAFGFLSACLGWRLAWRTPARSGRGEPQPILFSRTAVLMPIYNEDPGRILAAAQALYEDLAALGVAELYDLYLLSDTRDERIAGDEAAGVIRLRARLPGDFRLYYRRRERNIDRKAGNIADWVRRHGGDYPFMLVLDADSLMTGDTIVRLTAAMEADPKLGLLQTSPEIVGAETLFGRLQQFATRAYGRMLAVGQNAWSGDEGNFWGHNAIIRTRAFAESAGLPHLPGRKPFGGHIMSHDFVEAALLRRAGWAVRMATDLHGSYEEAPPTLLDMAIRDRRWCQGNLQHAGVVGAAGLHWVSRLHLMRGILSYLASPLWLLLLCAGAGLWAAEASPTTMAGRTGPLAAWLFGLTMALLVIPKLLAASLILRDAAARRGFGGGLRVCLGVAVEMAVSTLIAPVTMLMQSAAVLDVLSGRDSGWGVQQRDAGRLSRREAWRTHRAHVLLGLVGAGLALALDPAVFWWTSPVHVGLVLSAPLSALLARVEAGGLAARLGLLATPEERLPPRVVARAAELRAAYDAEAPVRDEIARLFRAPVQTYALMNRRRTPSEWGDRMAA
ncbi:glucans biosynthesis glucosyltransferase MdoH [Caulobacter mirabilis]|uniref:Glucans biosynthesis glucosyltransferase H n=2 Tax=Caulobacter mirabilis TaxID=69666 RepID=A0A2D2AT72_9CAUL|nr:glucans biosynthesis glucosyltransferase MdoH [Caulobacter mirabilis]